MRRFSLLTVSLLGLAPAALAGSPRASFDLPGGRIILYGQETPDDAPAGLIYQTTGKEGRELLYRVSALELSGFRPPVGWSPNTIELYRLEPQHLSYWKLDRRLDEPQLPPTGRWEYSSPEIVPALKKLMGKLDKQPVEKELKSRIRALRKRMQPLRSAVAAIEKAVRSGDIDAGSIRDQAVQEADNRVREAGEIVDSVERVRPDSAPDKASSYWEALSRLDTAARLLRGTDGTLAWAKEKRKG